MTSYPVTCPSTLEKMLFNKNLVLQVPLSDIYDIKAGTSVQRAWQDPRECSKGVDIRQPEQWNDKLHACMRGEFFVYALQECTRVLDVGCGEGWPSLYLARSGCQVVGVDLSPGHIRLAKKTAELMGLKNVEFRVAEIQNLPFGDAEFDGVCFGGNVFTYGFDPGRMLSELWRALKPGGVSAFEQWPVDRNRPPYERIQWFIDGGPPILHYGAGSGLFSRSYFIYLRPHTDQGRKLTALAGQMEGELSASQRQACVEIKETIESGEVGIVEKALYSGEDRSLAAEEFVALLRKAGFSDVFSWALPDAVAFGGILKSAGILGRLEQRDLPLLLQALVAATPREPGWRHQWVTCRK